MKVNIKKLRKARSEEIVIRIIASFVGASLEDSRKGKEITQRFVWRGVPLNVTHGKSRNDKAQLGPMVRDFIRQQGQHIMAHAPELHTEWVKITTPLKKAVA